jgi:hypothetical protein
VRPVAWALALSAVLVASGCSTGAQVRAMDQIPHVHNVVIAGDDIYLGSHEGLYRFSEGDGFTVVSSPFDVMGLSHHNDTFYASGHPGQGLDLPDPVGLLASTDGGGRWDSMSLTGEVDFHLLDVSGSTIIGAAANYGILVVSDDGGQTWERVDWPALFDFAINPVDSDQILLATGDGLKASSDGGETFTEVPGAPQALVVQWSRDGVILATSTSVLTAPTVTGPFTEVFSGLTGVIDVARSGSTIAVVDGHSLLISRDAGKTFSTW